MNTLRYSLLTFDLDDTLWDVRPVLERAELRVSAWLREHCPRVLEQFDRSALMKLRMQLLRERPEYGHQLGALRREAMRRAMLVCGQDETSALHLSGVAFDLFLDARHDVEPFADVEACLQNLQRDYLLGALTNGNADVFRLPFGRHFSFAFRAEDLLSSKPHPAHFEAALRAAEVGAERMIHIGDHPEHDILGAQQLGIATVWFNPTHKEWTGARPPDAEFSQFSELPALIAGLERDPRRGR